MLIPKQTKSNEYALFQAADTFMKLYNNIFLKYDATMVEINPMAEDNQGNGGFNNILLLFFIQIVDRNLATFQIAKRIFNFHFKF